MGTKRVVELMKSFLSRPYEGARYVAKLNEVTKAEQFSDELRVPKSQSAQSSLADHLQSNPLWKFFNERGEGRGIWKCEHYFDIYTRHLSKFVGCEMNIVEIGCYSGGSLEMWRHYFGERSHITGVDIQEACKEYENDHTTIFIGDQGSREFWRSFKRLARPVDVLIDDGGHHFEQQRVTLEEMLPHIQPGGVYICEDVLGIGNPFASYAHGFVEYLNAYHQIPVAESGLQYSTHSNNLQRLISSIHFYPYVVVIERSEFPIDGFRAVKRGSRWQPFL